MDGKTFYTIRVKDNNVSKHHDVHCTNSIIFLHKQLPFIQMHRAQ